MAVFKCSLYGRDAPDMDNESGSEEDPDDDGTYGRPEECADVSINCARLHKVDAECDLFGEHMGVCSVPPVLAAELHHQCLRVNHQKKQWLGDRPTDEIINLTNRYFVYTMWTPKKNSRGCSQLLTLAMAVR